MSVEKWFALYFPFKSLTICTVHSAKRISLVTCVIFLVFSSQLLFLQDLNDTEYNFERCMWIKASDTYIKIFKWMDSILYSFGPFTIMIIANSAIIYKFVKAKCQQKHNTIESTNQALSKSAMKGTAMLITVSITFILLTAPVSIILNLNLISYPMLSTIFYLLFQANHCINGVLYCIIGSRFRRELIDMLNICRKKSIATAHQSSVNVAHTSRQNIPVSSV